MKKILCILFTLLMLTSPALAETDYASMTDEELLNEINIIRNELNKRLTKIEKNTTLFDQDNLRLYTTGKVNCSASSFSDSVYLTIEVVFVNDTDKDLSLVTDETIMNGWTISAFNAVTASAHTKKKEEFTFDITDADIEKLEEVEDIIINFHTYSSEDYHNYNEVKGVKITVN